MGLDMYLTKKTYIGNQYRKPEQQVNIIIPEKDDATFPILQPIKKKRIDYIIEQVGYWRKANQIHNWFVQNIQKGIDDCGEYEVEEEKLQELLDICKQIKEKCELTDGAVTNGYTYENGVRVPIVEEGKEMINYEFAHELLPTRPGFFFGGTDYDQYYMADIDDTIKIIEDLFAERNGKEYLSGDIYYHSSW